MMIMTDWVKVKNAKLKYYEEKWTKKPTHKIS